ncbi:MULTISPECIES: hypothetical protein [unclassified Crossiella]|uniref:hypothetical protein n=1 Tax=unclassified Crossiella TaxID=2620835 RepID=UPI001FFF2981|nr:MULTISPECIES: hypothetical protein [unclassified Crossiella]MCK2245435.1 hypothetical protein [Crossiella sp. S99.2]MCK2259087.1 hypothetical protein [Crossiella sp. S99.1]
MDSEHQLATVIGQLVLAVGQHQLLPGARAVDYTVTEQGAVVLNWVAGPYAGEVATGLAAAPGPPEVAMVAPSHPGNNAVRADLLIRGVAVVLIAYEPIGRDAAARAVQPSPRRLPVWRWPTPLEDDGIARDTVLWTRDATGDDLAVGVRLPLERPEGWLEPSILVALPKEDLPPAWAYRERRIHTAWQTCDILLRQSGPELSVAAADDWLTAQFEDSRAFRSWVAVTWPDRCVIRLAAGLRMEIVCDGPFHGSVPWSLVPAVLYSAIDRSAQRRPPASVRIRQLGRKVVSTLAISTDWGAPSSRNAQNPI